MRTISGRRGNAAITGLAALIGAVMFFSVLHVFYTGVNDVTARSSAVRQAADVAAILDSVGSASAYCKADYRLPDKISGEAYVLRISGDHVIVSLSSPYYNASSVFFSPLSKNFSAPGGANLTIIKDNGLLEVTKDGM